MYDNRYGALLTRDIRLVALSIFGGLVSGVVIVAGVWYASGWCDHFRGPMTIWDGSCYYFTSLGSSAVTIGIIGVLVALFGVLGMGLFRGQIAHYLTIIHCALAMVSGWYDAGLIKECFEKPKHEV